MLCFDFRGNSRVSSVPVPVVENTPLVIRSLTISEDNFLRKYQTQKGGLPKSFRQLRFNDMKTYRISLTTEEQVALANSTAAREIRQVLAEREFKPENLLEKVILMSRFMKKITCAPSED